MAPVRFGNVQRDDMRERRVFLRQNKARYLLTVQRNNAIGARDRQKVMQCSLRIRDPNREAGLIQPVQRSEVVRFIRPKRNRHPAILRPKKCRGAACCAPVEQNSTLSYSFTVTVLTSV